MPSVVVPGVFPPELGKLDVADSIMSMVYSLGLACGSDSPSVLETSAADFSRLCPHVETIGIPTMVMIRLFLQVCLCCAMSATSGSQAVAQEENTISTATCMMCSDVFR